MVLSARGVGEADEVRGRVRRGFRHRQHRGHETGPGCGRRTSILVVALRRADGLYRHGAVALFLVGERWLAAGRGSTASAGRCSVRPLGKTAGQFWRDMRSQARTLPTSRCTKGEPEVG